MVIHIGYRKRTEGECMKIIIIGATGTIGSEVVKALLQNKHEVVRASRNGEVKVNLDDPASIRGLFDKIQGVDAVVSCAGNAAFKPFAELTDADYELGLRSKLMGQVALARIAKDHLRDGGSIVLTTGVLAMHPMRGSASISMVNAGLEGFVRWRDVRVRGWRGVSSFLHQRQMIKSFIDLDHYIHQF
jgi:NAD(P)-dependent dehydrogenase (short-subunit alcohol dehydrogenase family)